MLVKPIGSGKADVVFGSPICGRRAHRVLFFWHLVGNKFLTLFSNMATNLNLNDIETCYKVFRREVLQRITIEENRFGFEPEITAKVCKLKVVIYEVGISYYGRTYEEGKKISWRDGFRALGHPEVQLTALMRSDQPNLMATTEDFEFEALAQASNYRRALFAEFGPFLRGDVVEVGAGIGQMTGHLVGLPGVNRAVAVEPDPRFCARHRAQFPAHELVEGTVANLPAGTVWDASSASTCWSIFATTRANSDAMPPAS